MFAVVYLVSCLHKNRLSIYMVWAGISVIVIYMHNLMFLSVSVGGVWGMHYRTSMYDI